MGDELGDQIIQVRGAQHHEMIQALNLNRSNPAFDEGIQVGRARTQLSWAAAELRHKEAHKYSARIPKYDSVPTGVLWLTRGGIVDLSSEEALASLIEL